MVISPVNLTVSVLLLISGIILVVSAFGLAIKSHRSDSAGVSLLMAFVGLFAIVMSLGIISLIVFRQGAMVEVRESIGVIAEIVGVEPSIVVLGAYLILLLPFMYKVGYDHDKLKDIRRAEGGVDFFSNLKIVLLSDTINQFRSYFLISIFILFVFVVSMLNDLLEFMLLMLVLQIIIILTVLFYVLESYKTLEAATMEKTLENFLERLDIGYAEKTIIGGVNFYFEDFESRRNGGIADRDELSRVYHEVAGEISRHVRKQKRII